MSAADLAAVVAAGVALVGVVALVVALVSLIRSMRALREAVDTLRSETIPTVIELRDTVHRANHEIVRVEGLIDTAESITTTVDSASKLTMRAVSPALIRLMSVSAGMARVGRRLRGRGDRTRAIEVAVLDAPDPMRAGRTGRQPREEAS